MTKVATLSVLAASLAATAAAAQVTTEPPAPANSPPPAVSTLSAPQWYQPKGEELRSTKLVGSNVKNAAGETIGEINDIVLARNGEAAAVIGVGGFLGIGEHEVAVQFKSLSISRKSDGSLAVSLNATKDSLKRAPQWSSSSS